MSARTTLFLKNALLLSAVSLAMRGVSVGFNAWVNGKIGAESMGLFTLVMSVYGFAVTLALACVNLASVRLTSQRCALLDHADKASWKYAMGRVLRAVCLYALLFGVSSAVLLYASSGLAAEYLLRDMRTVKSLKILALSLPAIALSSALSGFFTGLRKAAKNAAVAVTEQLCKIAVTSTALVMVLPGTVENACLAVVGGSAVSEAWSLIWNAVLCLTDSKKPSDMAFGTNSVRLNTTFREAVEIALPSAVGACARQGLTTLEHLAIPVGLGKSGLGREAALASYGLLQGIAFPLVMFPYAVIGSFTSLLIPEMAERHALGDKTGIASLTEKVYRVSAMFSVGACGIFACFAPELGEIVYSSREAAAYTLQLGLLVPFMYLDTAVDALLKGLGEQVYTMKVNTADAACGLLLVILLTPVMGIYGYILCIWLCEIGNLWASIARLGKITGVGIPHAAAHYIRPVTVCLIAAALRFTCMKHLPPVTAMVLFAAVYLTGILAVPENKKRNLQK
ncbi:MAG: polysaccharide biosynthesis protein, partial [Clostridia bacterium]|nr:polysaccharide biosynthesis protein [Clostridia bacterium]